MKMQHILAPLVIVAMGLFATASYAINTVNSVSAPSSAVVGASVPISVMGKDANDRSICGSSISYGDGTPNGSTDPEQLPHGYSHVYTTPGVKTITANATGVCTGTVSTTIEIKSPPKPSGNFEIIPFSRIRSISGNAIAFKRANHRIKVMGNGNCKLQVKWGDGGISIHSNYNLSAPTYLYHRYNSTGTKTIRVTPASTIGVNLCQGSASKSVKVVRLNPPPRSGSRLDLRSPRRHAK